MANSPALTGRSRCLLLDVALFACAEQNSGGYPTDGASLWDASSHWIAFLVHMNLRSFRDRVGDWRVRPTTSDCQDKSTMICASVITTLWQWRIIATAATSINDGICTGQLGASLISSRMFLRAVHQDNSNLANGLAAGARKPFKVNAHDVLREASHKGFRTTTASAISVFVKGIEMPGMNLVVASALCFVSVQQSMTRSQLPAIDQIAFRKRSGYLIVFMRVSRSMSGKRELHRKS